MRVSLIDMDLSELFEFRLAVAVGNTLLVCTLSAGLAVSLGTSLALLLARTNMAGRKLAWIVLGSQLAVPLYVFCGGWSAAVGTQGWMTSLGWLGSSPIGSGDFLGSWGALWAVAAIHALAATPWVALLIAAGLAWRHRAEEEQAVLDQGWWNALRYCVLPGLQPWLLAAAIWCAIPVLTEMVVSNLYRVPTVAEEIYLDASSGVTTPLTYMALVLCSAVPLIGGLSWYAYLPRNHHDSFRPKHFQAQPLALYGWKWPLSGTVWLILSILVGIPILSLIAKAGWQPYTGEDGLNHYGWGLERLARTAYESATLFTEEFYWSGVLAVVSSTVALGGACLTFTFLDRRLRAVFSLLMLLAISIPGPAVGMFLIWAMNRSNPAWLGELYDRTLAAPVIAQQFRLLPLAWALVYVIVSSVSRSTWEQTRLDGLNKWARLRSVLIPQSGKVVFSAWLLLMVLSIGELSCTILILPPGVTTVSMRLFEMLHFGMRHQDSGLCGALLLLGWLVAWVLWKTLNDR